MQPNSASLGRFFFLFYFCDSVQCSSKDEDRMSCWKCDCKQIWRYLSDEDWIQKSHLFVFPVITHFNISKNRDISVNISSTKVIFTFRDEEIQNRLSIVAFSLAQFCSIYEANSAGFDHVCLCVIKFFRKFFGKERNKVAEPSPYHFPWHPDVNTRKIFCGTLCDKDQSKLQSSLPFVRTVIFKEL